MSLVVASAAVWFRHEDFVVWLLAEGLIEERATRALPGTVRSAALVVGVIGLAAAWRLAARPLMALYRWTPLHRRAAPVVARLRAVVIRLRNLARSVLLAVVNAIVSPLRLAWRATTTALAYVARAGAAVLRRLWLGVSTVGRLVGLIVVRPLLAVWLALAAVAVLFGRTVVVAIRRVELQLRALWRQLEGAFGSLRAAFTTVVRAIWISFVTVAGQLTLVVALLLYVGWLGLSVATRPLRTALASIAGAVAYMLLALWRGVVIVVASVRVTLAEVARAVANVLHTIWRGVTVVVATVRVALAEVARAVAYMLRTIWRGVTTVVANVRAALASIAGAAWLPLAIVGALVGRGVATIARNVAARLHTVWRGMTRVARAVRAVVTTYARVFRAAVAAVAGRLDRAVASVVTTVGALLDELWRELTRAARFVRAAVAGVLRPFQLAVEAIERALGVALRMLALVIGRAIRESVAALVALLALAAAPLLSTARHVVTTVWRHFRLVLATLFAVSVAVASLLWIIGSPPLRSLWLGLRTAALVLGWTLGVVGAAIKRMWDGFWWPPRFAVRTAAIGVATAWDAGRAAIGVARREREVSAMSDVMTRERVLSLIATVWAVGIAAFILVGLLQPPPPEPTVEVVHWSTGHLFREGLLPEMAERFNEEGHRTPDGVRIVVRVHNVPSELQAEYLVPRVRDGRGPDLTRLSDGYVEPGYGDPTIVTPSSAHWLVTVNYELGRELVDLAAARSIVRPVIGIVTYEEMARCLGWPEKELGFADILALRADEQGWAKYDCAKAEWGQRPLVAYTDPTTSSTGRSLLLALYAIAAGKPPEELTVEDVTNPNVVRYVEEFQGLVDHYLIGTSVLNTKIHQGPRYGHFFIMPEDNLIRLYEGTERAFINGVKVTAPPIDRRMVMIYPKEGSMPRSNCGCIVQGSWVTEEQAKAADQWLDYLLEDEQQRAFMAAGFRPGTDISLDDPSSKITSEFGLDPTKPNSVLNPSLIDPAVAAVIDESWVDVKRPGIVTFVLDTSGSMLGTKLRQAQDGLIAALDAMAPNNQVGFLAFDETVYSRVAVGPLAQNRFAIVDAVDELRAGGETALYDAIKAGVEMTDAAEGDPDAIRAVVVLTDGRANRGDTHLDDVIDLMSKDEVAVRFSGMGGAARDARGNLVSVESIIGIRLAIPTRDRDRPVQVFFIGIGDDADLDIGRMLAGATGAEFQGVTEEDLANLLGEISGYF